MEVSYTVHEQCQPDNSIFHNLQPAGITSHDLRKLRPQVRRRVPRSARWHAIGKRLPVHPASHRRRRGEMRCHPVGRWQGDAKRESAEVEGQGTVLRIPAVEHVRKDVPPAAPVFPVLAV